MKRQKILGIGGLVVLSVVALTGLAFQGLIGFSQGGIDYALLSDAYFHSILLFSIEQASLSAIISVVLAWPVARALYYAPTLPLQRSFLNLCLLCFVMPTLVLITGLVMLFGQSGLLTPWLGAEWNLYGLNGILMAHVYLNFPFAVRLLLQQLQHIPDTSWQLAIQLKLTSWQRLRLIEWPAIRGMGARLFGFIFILCFNSFAVVLALGGGPKSTTLEVAIYQALKYDFNMSEALTLAWVQLLLAGGLFLLLSRFQSGHWLSVDTLRQSHLPKPHPAVFKLYSGLYIAAWLLLLLPMMALVVGVFQADLVRFDWQAIFQPLLFSIVIGISVALIAVILAYCMLLPVRYAAARERPRAMLLWEWLATHTLVAPAMVLSVGLYIFWLPKIDLERWGILWLVILNVMIVVPFAVQQLKPRLLQYDAQYGDLVIALKLLTVQRWRAEWPFIRITLLSTFALVLLLAIGDVAIFSIFGSEEWMTLPWLIYSYAGSYRVAEASVASLMLLLFCGGIVSVFERGRQHVSR